MAGVAGVGRGWQGSEERMLLPAFIATALCKHKTAACARKGIVKSLSESQQGIGNNMECGHGMDSEIMRTGVISRCYSD